MVHIEREFLIINNNQDETMGQRKKERKKGRKKERKKER